MRALRAARPSDGHHRLRDRRCLAVLQAKIEFLKKDLEHLFDDVGIDASQCVGHYGANGTARGGMGPSEPLPSAPPRQLGSHDSPLAKQLNLPTMDCVVPVWFTQARPYAKKLRAP